jgi:hypothetical protein
MFTWAHKARARDAPTTTGETPALLDIRRNLNQRFLHFVTQSEDKCFMSFRHIGLRQNPNEPALQKTQKSVTRVTRRVNSLSPKHLSSHI